MRGKGAAFESPCPAQHWRNLRRGLIHEAILSGLAFLAHRFAVEFNAVSVMHQTVEDAVGDGRIADLCVPVSTGNWQVSSIDRLWYRASQISRKSRRSVSVIGAIAKSSTISTSILASFSSIRRWLPSACASARSRNNSAAFRNSAVKPSRQAFCASARASQVLPIPVGPSRNRF